MVSRRSFLAATALGVVEVATGGCSASSRGVGPPSGSQPPGDVVSGTFASAARHRDVAWSISYPPGHGAGDRLPLVLALHPFMGSHAFPMGGITPVRLLALPHMPPVAVAAADGGNGYWHAHPGDDPMAMLLDEFLPLCRRRGLGEGRQIGVIGTSMGGYGALLLAEDHPALVAAVGAVSPAIWVTYADADAANPTAFTGPADFADHDVITHVGPLGAVPVQVASGAEDPFHAGVEALAAALPAGDRVTYPPGAHTDAFFQQHAPAALRFAGHYAARTG